MISVIARRNGPGFLNNDTFRNYWTFSENGVDLALTECGYEKCDANHYWAGRKGFHVIHVVVSGRGTLEVDGQTYHINPGEAFYVAPDQDVHYTADAQDPWEYHWIGFTGTRGVMAINCTNLAATHVFKVPDPGAMCAFIKTIYDCACMNTEYGEYMAIGRLYQLLAELIQTVGGSSRPVGATLEYVNMAISLIREHYASRYMISDMSRQLNLTRSYLFKLFQRYYNMSPSDYLLRFRLAKAKELLGSRPCSVSEVVAKCGFCSHAYFTKRFREYYGMTPREYIQKTHMESPE